MFIVPISPMPTIKSITSAAEETQAGQNTGAGMPFANVLQDTFANMQETQAVSNQDAYNLAMGLTDDLHNVMINSEKAATALEMTVQLTTRMVNAYTEIMRMQV